MGTGILARNSITITDLNDITYIGEFKEPPINPEVGWTYKDLDDGIIYYWDGTEWIVWLKDGEKGEPGENGNDGTGVEFIFTRNNTGITPTTPISENEPDYVPSGWSDNQTGVTVDNQFEYVSKRVSDSNSNWGAFSTPALWARYAFDGEPGEPGADGKDGEGFEIIFTLTPEEIRPNTPVHPTNPEEYPVGWSDDAQGVTELLRYEWASRRLKINGIWSAYSTPALWARYAFDGENGEDGKDGATPNLLKDSERTRTANRFLEIQTWDILSDIIGKEITISFNGWINPGGIERTIQLYPYQNNGVSIEDSANLNFTFLPQRFSLTTTVKDWGIINSSFTKGSIALYDAAGNNNFGISHIQIGEGKSTIWSKNPEEIQEEINIISADTAILKAKTEGFTAIEGGVIYTNILSLQRVGGSQTAGVSGIDIDSLGNSLPAFWAGGTYQNAIDETSKIVMNHDGRAIIGQLDIDVGGTTKILNDSGDPIITLSNQNVLSESQLISGSQNETFSGTSTIYDQNSEPVDLLGKNILSNQITVNNNSSRLSISGSADLIIDGSFISGLINGTFSINATILLYSITEGKLFSVIKQLNAHLTGADNNYVYITERLENSLIVPEGIYELRVSYSFTNFPEIGEESIMTTLRLNSPSVRVSFTSTQKRNDFGADGILLSKDQFNFFRAVINSSGYLDLTMKSSSGTFDMPGILAAYSVASTNTTGSVGGGAIANRYGKYAKQGIQNAWLINETGKCKIEHNIGHTNYFVMVQPTDSIQGNFINHNISKKTNTSVSLEFSRDSWYNSPFDIIFFGNNE